MALLIKENCIDCDMCEPECPNQAISFDGNATMINPARCTECQGHYPEPTCIIVCPIDCIIIDPKNQETQEQLLDKYVTLHADTLLKE